MYTVHSTPHNNNKKEIYTNKWQEERVTHTLSDDDSGWERKSGKNFCVWNFRKQKKKQK